MKTFFKGLALLAAVTCVVWIAVLWRWQAAHRVASADDVLVYLVALPLVVFALAAALSWAVGRAWARQQAAGAAAAAATSARAAAPAAVPNTGARERGLGWPVFGAWCSGPAGDDVEALLDAAKAGKPGPAPDAQLRDEDGLPVFCARSTALATDGVQAAWAAWSATSAAPGGPPARPHVLRALAALEPLLAPAGELVQGWAETLPAERGRTARVRLLAAWPASWREGERLWADAWLHARCAGLAPQAIGADRWVAHPLPPGSGPQAWGAADALLLALERECSDDRLLLLACHSDLGDDAVQALERQQRLFSADRRPKGWMPGEGAAALLLARAGTATPPGVPAPLGWLHRPVCLRRDKSIDAAGRTGAETARQAAAEALTAAGMEAAQVAALCSDADRHSARATELFATTVELLPDLDPIEDMRLLGAVQGHAAQTGALWAVAGALTQAAAAERPALALSLADEHWRLAAVARHLPPAAPAS
jgi:hypothetical protein